MEDLNATQELQAFTLPQIITESVKIPFTTSPRRFLLITLTLILPLSIAQLLIDDHHMILIDIYNQFSINSTAETHKELISAFIYEFFYIICLLIFSLLSTAATVFTVASLYASKPVSFIPTLYAIRRIFKPLFITLFYFFVLAVLYHIIFMVLIFRMTEFSFLIQINFLFPSTVVSLCYLVIHGYFTALWHLACVVSVLEPGVYGVAALQKSEQLMRGKIGIAYQLVICYFGTSWVIGTAFRDVVVDHYEKYNWMIRVLVGFLCVVILVALNLIGLLVQSVFYHVCKSFHHEEIDKRILYDHLGEHCEPLRTTSDGNIELQNIHKKDADAGDDMAGDMDDSGSYVGPTLNS